jgi:hypothetical protein
MTNWTGCLPNCCGSIGATLMGRLIALLLLAAAIASSAIADPSKSAAEHKGASENKAAVSKAATENKSASEKQHPLDPAIKVAREGLDYIRENVQDYTCTIIKRERVNEVLGEYQFMTAKIRHQRENNGTVEVPFSVYLKFMKPKSVEGREVIWIAGRNDGKFVVHESGLLNFKRVWLPPNGYLAMNGQRYPITEIGVQNLVVQLIARAERDRKHDEIDVKFFDNSKVNERPCRMIQVIHPEKRAYFDFYKAEIFIDHEMKVPIRYAAWSWPEKAGGEPLLLEEYTYVDMKLNVGLTDKDFDPDNKEYNFPRL